MEEEKINLSLKRDQTKFDQGAAWLTKRAKTKKQTSVSNKKFSFTYQRKHTQFISRDQLNIQQKINLLPKASHTEILLPEVAQRLLCYDLKEEDALQYWQEWMDSHHIKKNSIKIKRIPKCHCHLFPKLNDKQFTVSK